MNLDLARAKMRDGGVSDLAIEVFSSYYDQLASGQTGLIPEFTIEPLGNVESLAEIEIDPGLATEALSRTVVVKLNGGLGTSMGMDRAKSLLPVRDGKTFLDIMCDQIRHLRSVYGVTLPLIFMNSFRTRTDTLAALPADMRVEGIDVDFVQGREPKLRVDDLSPVSWPADPSLEWCPPGHGDFYTTITDLGLIDRLRAAGYRYMCVSNSDNLGATPDPVLAGWFAQSGSPYSPEVCVRTPADRKGGHLARRTLDGRVILRDSAQTPPEDQGSFMDETRHRYFHTNNLWFNLDALAQLLSDTGGVVGLPLIRNKKTVDPADPASPEVYQIECAIGAIVERFEGATPILVPRSRFLPVKTTSDLLVLRSDAYELGPDGTLAAQTATVPTVSLDGTHYRNIADFDDRFAVIPSLKDARTLAIEGDWTFTGPATFTGDTRLAGGGVIGPQ